jgi:hypothetical protein
MEYGRVSEGVCQLEYVPVDNRADRGPNMTPRRWSEITSTRLLDARGRKEYRHRQLQPLINRGSSLTHDLLNQLHAWTHVSGLRHLQARLQMRR